MGKSNIQTHSRATTFKKQACRSAIPSSALGMQHSALALVKASARPHERENTDEIVGQPERIPDPYRSKAMTHTILTKMLRELIRQAFEFASKQRTIHSYGIGTVASLRPQL